MKKIPLALGALAIATISTVGGANQTYATAVPNVGIWSELPFKITRINPRDNRITVMAERVNAPGQSYFNIVGLDLGRAEEEVLDQVYVREREMGYMGTNTVKLAQGRLSAFAQVGVEVEVPSSVRLKNLQENTTGVIYYLAQVLEYGGFAGGKIDYSQCVKSVTYQEAVANAEGGDVVECRAEVDRGGEGFHYQPYWNETRLEIVMPEEGGSGGSVDSDGGANSGEGVDSGENFVEVGMDVVKNTGTGVRSDVTTVDTGVGASVDGGGEANRIQYATVTSERSASVNSETRGTDVATMGVAEVVTSDGVAKGQEWKVDAVETQGEDIVIDTPKLGEEDCGHWWPLVVGWGLAAIGWGSAIILFLKKRK